MAPAQLVEYLTSRTRSSVDDIVPTLPDSLVNVCPSGAVEQSLIGFRVLHYGLGLAVDGQDHRPLALLHLLRKFPRFPPEICQRLNVLRDVEHGHSSVNIAPIRALQIIVTVPVLLDLLLCHSRAWLPREESRSFPTSSSGIRDSSRAPDTRAGMTEKFHRADVRVTILCRTQLELIEMFARKKKKQPF